MLMQGKVQAIVYEAPTLQYWAAKRGSGAHQVVGPIFRPEKYGIAVASGSPLRKQINEALLKMYADGSYEDIYGKWFSQGKLGGFLSVDTGVQFFIPRSFPRKGASSAAGYD